MLARLLSSMWPRRPRAAAADPRVERALSCYRMGAYAQAESHLHGALRERPADAGLLNTLALVYIAQERPAEAAALLQRALALDPTFAPAHYHIAILHRDSGRLEAAIAHFEAACRADPDLVEARGELLHALLLACDWNRADEQADVLREFVERAPPHWMGPIAPFTAYCLKLDPSVCRQVAEYHARLHAQDVGQPFVHAGRGDVGRPKRLKIGYFSADFRDHALGRLLNGAFGHHDRSRFEIHAYSFGPRDSSHYRDTIAASVDRFVDVVAQSDADAAQTIANDGIDVLIDLTGHSVRSRLGVLARRPAPVQAHYLGAPYTTGAGYIDYFITDAVVTPPVAQDHFTEALAYVPDCYQLSDGAEARELVPASRAGQGLPDDAYVYANFSTASRLDRATFTLWMRVLEAVPRSVLWLLAADPIVEKNLRRVAAAHGVDPARLVFGKREMQRRTHLSRLACADLALDMLGWCNGHTTSGDMLWAGVPVLTTLGDTFLTRVAASLVTAAGMPELVAATRDDYVAHAVALGRDRNRSRALHDRLRRSQGTAPFFQTDRLVRGLEAVYDAMYACKMRGLAGSVAQSVRAGDS